MPYIRDFAVTETTTAAASVTPDMPEHEVDDILVVFANKDATPTFTETTGLYTAINLNVASSQARGSSWYRRATSSAETPPTLTYSSETSDIVVIAVAGASTSTNPTGNVNSASDSSIPYTQNTSFTTGANNALLLWAVSTDSGQGPAPFPHNAQVLYAGDSTDNSCGVSWGFFPTSGTETSGANFFGAVADDCRVFVVQVPDNGNCTKIDGYVDRASAGPTLLTPLTGATLAFNGVTFTVATSNQLQALGRNFDIAWNADAVPNYTDVTAALNNSTGADITLNNTSGSALYMGNTSTTFDSIVIDVSATVGTGSPTAVWEYSTGSGSWTTLPGLTPSPQNFTAAGPALTRWRIPSNWVSASVNGTSAYYIRRRVTGTWTIAPILDQGWLNGRALTFDTISAVADSGVNPYWGSHTATPAVLTNLNHGGGEITFSAQDWNTGYLLTTCRLNLPRDFVDMGFYKLHKGVSLTLLDSGNDYKSWIIGSKNSPDTVPDKRRVIGIQPAQTTDTSWAGQGTFDANAIDTILLTGADPYGALSVELSMLLLSGESALAGGLAWDPLNFDRLIEAFVNGNSLFPILERLGSAATIWNPIRIGGGDPVHVSINLRTFQFPTRADSTERTTQWHVDDNQIGIEFYPKIESFLADAYSKSFNANTSGYTNEGTDWNDVGANDVALPPIQDTTTGDAIYFGHNKVFGSLRLNIGTAAVTSGYTLEWQYYNGSWLALSEVSDNTNFFQISGTNNVYWNVPTDWITTSVNSQTAYWIRCIVTVKGTTSTSPLGTQGYISGDTCKFTNCVFTGDTPYYWRINSSASPGAIWSFSGTSVAGATVTLRDVTTFSDMSFINCSEIALNDANITSSTIRDTRATTAQGAVAFTSSSEAAGIIGITFTDNNDGDIGHSIRITNTGTYTFDQHTFSGGGPAERNFLTSSSGIDATNDIITLDANHGYTTGDAIYYQDQGGSQNVGLVDGTLYYVNKVSNTTIKLYDTKANAIVGTATGRKDLSVSGSETHYIYSAKADVFNNSGGAITINILNGGNTPTIRNSDQSSTTINNSVTLQVTVVDSNNNPIENAQTAIYKSSDGTQLMNEDTNVNGIATETFNYTTDTDIYVRVRKSSVGDTRYYPASTTGSITSSGFTITVILIEDPTA